MFYFFLSALLTLPKVLAVAQKSFIHLGWQLERNLGREAS